MKGKGLLVYWFVGLLVLPFGGQCFGQDIPGTQKNDTLSLAVYDTMLVNGKKIIVNLGPKIKRPINYSTLANFDFEKQLQLNNDGLILPSFRQYDTARSITLPDKVKRKRIRLVTAANIAGYGGAMIGLYSAWYKDYPQTNFHFFNDNAEWLQVDKVGHAWSAYMEGRTAIELWKWAGLTRKQQIWIGGLSGTAYQTAIETLDGFCSEWGWSWGDFTANIVGSGMVIAQELMWDEQRISFKWSFHTKSYKSDPVLKERTDSIFGTSILDRMLKDYNAQTYWLSANIKSFFPKSNVPSWLNVAVGYGAEGMLDADENEWFDRQGNKVQRFDIDRYRQWYLAPDIDFTRIKTKSKFLKRAFFVLNLFKFPTPSIGFSKKGVEFNWIHF